MPFLPLITYFKGLKAIKDFKSLKFKSLKGRILGHLIFILGVQKWN